MYNPLVSIIIPVYNGSNYLSNAIDSALAQTYKNIEVIVVNDGSSDNNATESIALAYGNKIRYFHKENGGVSTALNLGIKNMKGEYFSWLSHDDLYMPTKIDSAIRTLNVKNLDKTKTILSCKTGFINSYGESIFFPMKHYNGLYNGEEMFKNLLNGKNLSGCSLLIPYKVLSSVTGFNTKYKYIQDWVCWILLAYNGCSFYLYDEELIKSRIHENQGTKKISNLYPIENIQFLSEILEELRWNRNNIHYLKIVLNYGCTKVKDKHIRKEYIFVLKEMNAFSNLDSIRYLFFLIRGQSIRVIKIIYRWLKNLIYRGTK